MSSVREQIIVAAVAALNTGRPGNVPEFVRTRVVRVSPVDLPANDVIPKTGSSRRGPGGLNSSLMVRKLILAIHLHGAPSPGVTPDQAIDPSYVWAVNTLTGNQFGGLATDCIETDAEDDTFRYEMFDDVPVCTNAVDFEVTYSTALHDATAKN